MKYFGVRKKNIFFNWSFEMEFEMEFEEVDELFFFC